MSWLVERTRRFPKDQRFVLAARVQRAGFDLLEAVSVALVRPGMREPRLLDADDALIRLRPLLRLARDLHFLSASQVAHAISEADEVGKMVGGFLRSTRHRHG